MPFGDHLSLNKQWQFGYVLLLNMRWQFGDKAIAKCMLAIWQQSIAKH
jgi:hypothetical protein